MRHLNFALAFLVLPLGGVVAAKAESIAYNLADYAQASETNDVQSVSGQIITDGAMGSFANDFASHITSASLTVTTSDQRYVVSSAEAVSYPSFPTSFEATPSSLAMRGGGYFSLLGLTAQKDLIDLTWYNDTASGSSARPYLIVDLIKSDFTDQFSVIAPPVTGGIDADSTWLLATERSVPEPAVSLGVGASMLGLCAIYMQERKGRRQ